MTQARVKRIPESDTPNPGSEEALNQSCRCPVLDNAHGRGAVGMGNKEDGTPNFWVVTNCPLHGEGKEEQIES